MAKDIFRRQLAGFQTYVAGKPIEQVRREYGLERIEKLASNENQFGPSPKALQAIRDELEDIFLYPEASAYDLAHDLADYWNVDFENIVVGNGGEGLIWVMTMTFINEGDEIVMPTPSFDIYKIAANLMGAKLVHVPFKDKEYDFEAMLSAVNEKTKIVYICTPNNPTGTIARKEAFYDFVNRLPEDVVLVIDEAYYDFALDCPDYPADNITLTKQRPNTIVLRSFSKIYGIAGVRIGYLVAPKDIANKMNLVRQTLGVNRLGQIAARAALKDKEYREYSQEENVKQRAVLERYFASKGFEMFPSYANFVWVNIERDSRPVYEDLQKMGVVIRPGFLWGWDQWIRVNTGRPEQMEFFMQCMDDILAKGEA